MEAKILKEEILRFDHSKEELERIFNLSNDLIGFGNLEGYFIKTNLAFERILGYTEKEFTKNPFIFFVHGDDAKKTKEALFSAINGKENIFIENRYRCKDGKYKWIEWKVVSIKQENRFYAIGREITKRKQTEELLKEAKDDLENKISKRTIELEEVNTALRVLIKNKNLDVKEIEEELFYNFSHLISPNLEELKKTKLSAPQKKILKLIEDVINQMISSLGKVKLSSPVTLTPSEIKIANYIKSGKTSKEIAEINNISIRTVESYRMNIRKKLGIKNKKVNMRVHLSSDQ